MRFDTEIVFCSPNELFDFALKTDLETTSCVGAGKFKYISKSETQITIYHLIFCLSL